MSAASESLYAFLMTAEKKARTREWLEPVVKCLLANDVESEEDLVGMDVQKLKELPSKEVHVAFMARVAARPVAATVAAPTAAQVCVCVSMCSVVIIMYKSEGLDLISTLKLAMGTEVVAPARPSVNIGEELVKVTLKVSLLCFGLVRLVG